MSGTILSTDAWQRRTKRVVAGLSSYWVGLSGVSQDIGWMDFGKAISLPIPVMGAIGVFLACWYSSGHMAPTSRLPQ